MRIPDDLPPPNLRNWLQYVMDRAQEDMGRYVTTAFGRQYVHPLSRASKRRLFYMSRDRYEEAKKVMEGM